MTRERKYIWLLDVFATEAKRPKMIHAVAAKFEKWTSTAVLPTGSESHRNNCCVQRRVDSVKPDSIFLRVHQKPTLAGSQKGINYTLTDSQFWLQTQWVQHKQTLVSIHSRRWIKQHQSLSTPLISPLSQLLHFAQNLLTDFIVRFDIRDSKASDFFPSVVLLPRDAQLSFNSLSR